MEEVHRIRSGVGHGASVPSLDTPPSQHLNVVTNLEVLRTLWFRVFFFLINLFILFIYFWLHWVFVAAQVFSIRSKQGLLFIAVRGLLIAVASLVVEHRL